MGATPNNAFGSNPNIAGSIASATLAKTSNAPGLPQNDGKVQFFYPNFPDNLLGLTPSAPIKARMIVEKFSSPPRISEPLNAFSDHFKTSKSSETIKANQNTTIPSIKSVTSKAIQANQTITTPSITFKSSQQATKRPIHDVDVYADKVLNVIRNYNASNPHQLQSSQQNLQANNAATPTTNNTQQRSSDMNNVGSTPTQASLASNYEKHNFMSHNYDGPHFGTYAKQK